MRVERLAQPRLDLVGITAGGQLDHVRILFRRARVYVGHDGVRLWFAELVRGGSKHELRVEQIQPNGTDEVLATGLVDLPGHSPVAEFYGSTRSQTG
jgi:hypothetical protein